MKYSIIMPYLNRSWQLHNTLVSFQYFYQIRDDFEIIIVEDKKNIENVTSHNDLISVLNMFSNILNIKHIQYTDKIIYNPAPLFNHGFDHSIGNYLIFTSPECFHKVNILNGFDGEFDKDSNKYIICSCESAKNVTATVTDYCNFDYHPHMWYQHSVHRNTKYHFCSALSRHNYIAINGFDNNYGDGYCFDDNDFMMTVKNANIPFIIRDDLKTIHQEHSKSYRPGISLWNKNKQLFINKWGEEALDFQ